jgi:hypothetical protein
VQYSPADGEAKNTLLKCEERIAPAPPNDPNLSDCARLLMPLSAGSKVLRGWLIFNALLDLFLVGLVPLLHANGVDLPVSALSDMFSKTPLIRGNDTFALRLAAWGFIKDGLPRFAAGAMGWSASGSPLPVDLLCIGSYLTEVLQYGSEALIFGSTDVKAVIGNLLIPTVVSASIYLSTGGLKHKAA